MADGETVAPTLAVEPAPGAAAEAGSPLANVASDAPTPALVDASGVTLDSGAQHDAAEAPKVEKGRDDWSDEEKAFRMRFLELSSEGDKQLAFANTTALRTVATEKRLWLRDRYLADIPVLSLAFSSILAAQTVTLKRFGYHILESPSCVLTFQKGTAVGARSS